MRLIAVEGFVGGNVIFTQKPLYKPLQFPGEYVGLRPRPRWKSEWDSDLPSCLSKDAGREPGTLQLKGKDVIFSHCPLLESSGCHVSNGQQKNIRMLLEFYKISGVTAWLSWVSISKAFAQVMTLWFVSLSPTPGSVTSQDLEPTSDSVSFSLSLSLSLCPSSAWTLFLSLSLSVSLCLSLC